MSQSTLSAVQVNPGRKLRVLAKTPNVSAEMMAPTIEIRTSKEFNLKEGARVKEKMIQWYYIFLLKASKCNKDFGYPTGIIVSS